MEIVLDTNFLVYLFKSKKFNLFLDFLNENFGKYEIYVFETTLAEIGNINKRFLKLVKLLIKEGKIKLIKEKGKVDELITKYKDKFVVASLDKELLEKVNKKITVKGKYFQLL
ncbi:MAG: hypothetical protein QXQ14_01860 [Candidatus Aenigmatarchaeota archaeon]